MDRNFNTAFDNFIAERIGEDIARLRDTNERYSSALLEYSELIQKAENNEGTDYKQAFVRLAELATFIRDTEYRFLYYAGMAAYKRMDETVLSASLLDRLTE